MDSKIIVTIGRQIGGGGFVIGERLAKALNVPFYDKELINLIAEKSGISREVIETYDEKAAQSLFHSAWSVPMHSNERPLGQQLFFAQCDAIRDVAKEGSSVILGRCADYALSRGIIIADTKFEFGLDENGNIVLGDEMLTPDSSRFWPADGYEPGHGQPSFDKQFARDWLKANPDNDWTLPDDIVQKTIDKYLQGYEMLTGEKLQ